MMVKKMETTITIAFRVYGLGSGGSGLIIGITRVTIWVMGVTNLLAKSP